ncbi:hypothetical protein DSCO28_42790 [Desulfosarcina ovata subsp. sediminis]|uniref:Oxidoreductase molybdopterin-binding domain-containing protein n=1 Tax=Desulfosarcina ovata subsp. sediminis TaxID=885957 RepID=A0A5K7ZU17_9BACT|nr:hypothetical protein [Desulfosarcina ovata]BBO83713.1 hypothetical protein DSCO28_42790 [Desulfosarcina ovata subsp. sediminis]
MTKKIVLAVIAAAAVFFYYRQIHRDYYDYLTMSGATPLAVARRVPAGVRLEIDGLVKKTYRFSGDALNALATTRIRTREISPTGNFLGAYIHVGIPAFNILEGIAPKKPDHAGFDQPLDILVTFHSASGKRACFSFNELIMTGDGKPVTLAFSRQPVEPTTDAVREQYTGNIYAADLEGLRLICPREPDTARYLENVVRISYTTIPVDEKALPPRRKKFSCRSDSITCIDGNTATPGILAPVARTTNDHWIRIGHGHGYDEIATVEGYRLRDFLRTNFPGLTAEDFFLFVACDGYRALFSGREIFSTDDGAAMIIADRLNGKRPAEGYLLAPTRDFFSDRGMWGFSQVVWIHHTQIEE